MTRALFSRLCARWRRKSPVAARRWLRQKRIWSGIRRRRKIRDRRPDALTELTKQGIIAREQNDQFQTLALAADKAVTATRASIESAKAAIQGAEAKLGEARLQLNYATIRAPISGRAGNVSRKTGNIVTANSDTLVIINQLSPVYASFTVPEQSLPELRRYAAGGKLRVHAMPQGGVSAADGAEGVLDFLDNTVDTASGTILLKAKFPNKNRQLWPGQFVNVSVRLANPTETVVPSAAVRTAQQGSYVFVVKPDSTAEQRTIETARSFDETHRCPERPESRRKGYRGRTTASEARLESQDPTTQKAKPTEPARIPISPCRSI